MCHEPLRSRFFIRRRRFICRLYEMVHDFPDDFSLGFGKASQLLFEALRCRRLFAATRSLCPILFIDLVRYTAVICSPHVP